MNNIAIKLENKEDKDKLLIKIEELECDQSLEVLTMLLASSLHIWITYYSKLNIWGWTMNEADLKEHKLKVITIEEFLNYKRE